MMMMMVVVVVVVVVMMMMMMTIESIEMIVIYTRTFVNSDIL